MWKRIYLNLEKEGLIIQENIRKNNNFHKRRFVSFQFVSFFPLYLLTIFITIVIKDIQNNCELETIFYFFFLYLFYYHFNFNFVRTNIMGNFFDPRMS